MKSYLSFAVLFMFILFLLGCQSNNGSLDKPVAETQFVFKTDNLKRYEFPTHINDLVIDRMYSTTSEVFMVIVEPGKTVMHHKHDDTEQVFYMISGNGVLLIGPDKIEHRVEPGDVVRIPVSTLHSIKTLGTEPIKYLCVDCFTQKPLEPTWDEHVKVVCSNNGWSYTDVVK